MVCSTNDFVYSTSGLDIKHFFGRVGHCPKTEATSLSRVDKKVVVGYRCEATTFAICSEIAVEEKVALMGGGVVF